MKHVDGTGCAGANCAWKNQEGFHVTELDQRWETIWNETCAELHDKMVPHDSGYCRVCRGAGVDLAGQLAKKVMLTGDPIVAMHVLGDGLARALEAIVSLWALEVGAPDLRAWPTPYVNIVMSVFAHNAVRGNPSIAKTLDREKAQA